MYRVAVDFDGTIVEDRFPEIGKPRLFAFETLKAMQGKGMQLILWTVRTGPLLDAAVEFCRQHGVEFYAVNSNHPDEVAAPGMARKISADLFIDDRNVGGLPPWGEVWNLLSSGEPLPKRESPTKRGLFAWFCK